MRLGRVKVQRIVLATPTYDMNNNGASLALTTYLRSNANKRRVRDLAVCLYCDRAGADEQRIR
ncbi:MAG: hypothetical protein QOI77_719 [Blastocatellia bacterium]|nr:hypothetical protein [Blastocatellia bacterium]